jgi:hypothetical protein
MQQGKYVIALMLAIGVGAAGLSLWHHRNVSRHALQYWGQDAARQILRATQITAIQFENSGDPDLTVVDERDASQSRGLINIRQALVQDAAYDWDDLQPAAKTAWEYGLRFEGSEPSATVLFSFAEQRLCKQGQTTAVALDDAAARVLKDFMTEQFDANQSAPLTQSGSQESDAAQ